MISYDIHAVLLCVCTGKYTEATLDIVLEGVNWVYINYKKKNSGMRSETNE